MSSVAVNGTAATGGTASGSGTANWSATVNLVSGANTITVVAKDNLSNSTTQSITITYTPIAQTGSLQVTLTPAGAINAGAQWQVDGSAWQNSGATFPGLLVGTHTVTFSTISGYTTPASQVVTISANASTPVTGAYMAIAQTGSLQVTLTPAGAINAGAQWQVDGSAWQNSGATFGGLSVGPHTVTFSTVSGYTTPASQVVTVAANQTAPATGTYVAIPTTGSLQVTLTPTGAVNAGAQWSVDGSAWQNSGATFTGLSVGSHTVAFTTVSGFSPPAGQTVTVNANATTTITGTYGTQGSNVIFSDNFDENTIDSTKWTTTGNTVVDSGGIMQVETTVTDQPGILTSTPIAVSSNGLITLSRQVILHRDTSSGHYFTGLFSIKIGNLPAFGINYNDYDYSDSNLMQSHGFYVVRNGASATNISEQADVGPAITPIWDTWFNETITYDPASGQMEYFINGVNQTTFNVGALPASNNPTMTLTFEAYGWWTTHYQDMDNFVVTQSTGSSLMPFSQWQTVKFGANATNPLIAGATATPQNDGVPNILKYLYDINPSGPMSASDRAALPALGIDDTTTPGTEYLTLTYRENQLMTGITVNVQTSSDLQTWTTLKPSDVPPDFLSQQVGADSGDPIMEVGVKLTGAKKQFIRLNVTSP